MCNEKASPSRRQLEFSKFSTNNWPRFPPPKFLFDRNPFVTLQYKIRDNQRHTSHEQQNLRTTLSPALFAFALEFVRFLRSSRCLCNEPYFELTHVRFAMFPARGIIRAETGLPRLNSDVTEKIHRQESRIRRISSGSALEIGVISPGGGSSASISPSTKALSPVARPTTPKSPDGKSRFVSQLDQALLTLDQAQKSSTVGKQVAFAQDTKGVFDELSECSVE